MNICLAENWALPCLFTSVSLCSKDRHGQSDGFCSTEQVKKAQLMMTFQSQQLLKSERVLFSIIFMFNEMLNPPP